MKNPQINTRLPPLIIQIITLLFITFTASAQSVGDSSTQVISLLGKPNLTRNSGTREIWLYPDGTKITFENGAVVDVLTKGPPILSKDELPAAEKTHSASTPKSSHPTTADTAQKPSRKQNKSKAEYSTDQTTAKGSTPGKSKLGGFLSVIGIITVLICHIVLIVLAFKESVLWGLGVLFIPIFSLFFVVSHWSETKTTVLVMLLLGYPAIFISYAM